ncbi:MAG: Protein kinase [Candidatus Collierbacteria bacterium GW2011_GWB1_44_6]|uniref:Protein kinase n=2 Tax=Candidatus Collieribacteriota TaxID=1752725 RepID=A0A0G1JJT3_9BACT|nr:MAG: Protein kinase [Candidatus Collierbacteria bacterium GW2011_GWC2_43_12]KKT71633.1 MAG: Protein kinase [Candidatus Collierbacteria bacterium GW2011_GWB1_44_6]
MSKKNIKIVLVVGGVVVIAVLCVCFLVGALLLLGNNNPPSPEPTTQTQPLPLQAPSLLPPTPVPASTLAPPPTDTAVNILPSDAEINLNGKTLAVYSVIYSDINGGEDSVSMVTNPDQHYVLVTLYSNDKDMGFFYQNYSDSVLLIDPVSNESYEFDYMNWSLDDSPSNSGYIKISFPVSNPFSQAVLHIADGVEIDLTPLLPVGSEFQNPWIAVELPFIFDNIPLQVKSAEVFDSYFNPVEQTMVEKVNPTDKIFVLTFTSSQTDLSYFGSVLPFILVDGTNQWNQYGSDYYAWTTAGSIGDGELLYIFVIPENTGSYVLYLPYYTLIDLTPIISVQ